MLISIQIVNGKNNELLKMDYLKVYSMFRKELEEIRKEEFKKLAEVI